MSSLKRSINTVLSASVEKYSSSSTLNEKFEKSFHSHVNAAWFLTSVPSSSMTKYTSSHSSISNFSLAERAKYISWLQKVRKLVETANVSVAWYFS